MLLAAAPDDSPALLDEGGAMSFGELRQAAAHAGDMLAAPQKALVWLTAENTTGAVVAYLAALAAGHAVALLPPGLPSERSQAMLRRYRPDIILGGEAPPAGWKADGALAGLPLWRRPAEGGLHPDLCLLLATSGSTGNPRLVRLSHRAVAANARQIVAALAITPEDRALLHLPLFYSFGLSVLNSHLAAGAPVVLAREGLAQKGLWELARRHRATVLPGVPVQFEMLRRLNLDGLEVPQLATFIQAGGRLAPAAVRFFAAFAAKRGGRFHVMYGQTEAAPRMAVMPAAEVARRPAQAGHPVPGGRFEIVGSDGESLPRGQNGEIVYRGPNVMMGYARERADLGRGDEMGGRLATGDIGNLDAEGFLTVTGRSGRFAKIDGLRLDLSDVEALAGGDAVAVEGNDRLILFTTAAESETTAMRTAVARGCHLHPGRIEIRRLPELPTLPSGKPDRHRLETLA